MGECVPLRDVRYLGLREQHRLTVADALDERLAAFEQELLQHASRPLDHANQSFLVTVDLQAVNDEPGMSEDLGVEGFVGSGQHRNLLRQPNALVIVHAELVFLSPVPDVGLVQSL